MPNSVIIPPRHSGNARYICAMAWLMLGQTVRADRHLSDPCLDLRYRLHRACFLPQKGGDSTLVSKKGEELQRVFTKEGALSKETLENLRLS